MRSTQIASRSSSTARWTVSRVCWCSAATTGCATRSKVHLLERELANLKRAHANAVAFVGAFDEAMRLEGLQDAEDVVLGHAELAGELGGAELVGRAFEGAEDVEGAGDGGDGVGRGCRGRVGMHHRTPLG